MSAGLFGPGNLRRLTAANSSLEPPSIFIGAAQHLGADFGPKWCHPDGPCPGNEDLTSHPFQYTARDMKRHRTLGAINKRHAPV